MSEVEEQPPPNTDLPYWLLKAQIVNLGIRATFRPYPDDLKERPGAVTLQQQLSDVSPQIETEIYALDALQSTRTSSFGPGLLHILLNALVEALPQPIQDRVSLNMGISVNEDFMGPALRQSNWFRGHEDDFEQVSEAFESKKLELLSPEKEFVLWTVDGGTYEIPYYITIVLRYGPLGGITDWGIVDALSIEVPSATTRIAKDRLVRLLRDHGIADAAFHQIWVPPYQEGEEFASGLVAYTAVAQLLDRIGVAYCAGREFDADTFFAPTRPWFNPDALRAESLGRVAMKAMERFNWKVRLALFPTQHFSEDRGPRVPLHALAPSETPPIAHIIPAADVAGDGDSLFGGSKGIKPEYIKDEDVGDDDIKEEDIKQEDIKQEDIKQEDIKQEDIKQEEIKQENPPSPSASSSSSSYNSEKAELYTLESYVGQKTGELAIAYAIVEGAENACREAAKFAEQVVHEVLEAPVNNIPSAYAAERLTWMIKHAQIETLAGSRQCQSVETCWSVPGLHVLAMETMGADDEIAKLREKSEGQKASYEASQAILNRVLEARKGRTAKLFEVVPSGSTNNVAKPGPSGRKKRKSESKTTSAAPGDAHDAAKPGPSGQKKRKVKYETTSAIDNDGHRVYTLDVHKRANKAKKGNKSKKN